MRQVTGVLFLLMSVVPARAEQPTCYSRSYDAAHLARYPHQTVTSMGLALKPQAREYQFWVTRRGSRVLQYNAGHCDGGAVKGKQGLLCHAEIECDGDCGSLGVVFESRNSVLIHFRDVTTSFLLNSDEGHAYITPELDDGVFRLGLSPQDSCAFNPEYAAQVPDDPNLEPGPQIPLSEGFQTPSGNIYCKLAGSAGPDSLLQCEIREIDGLFPQRPAWCQYDWGQAFEVGIDADSGTRLCASDSLWSEGYQALPYGMVWTQGGFTCSSSEAGLDCRNRRGKGFFLSRKKQSLY